MKQVKKKAELMNEKIVDSMETLIESLEWNEEKESAKITIIGVTADVVNGNRRLYPKDVLRESIAELSHNLKRTSARSGRRLVTGEIDHPSTKGNKEPLLNESVILWESVEWSDENNGPILVGETFPSSKGKEFASVLRFLYEREMPIPISQRGYGVLEIQNIDGQQVSVVESLKITGYDFVIQQSDPFAGVLALEAEAEAETETEANEEKEEKMDTNDVGVAETVAQEVDNTSAELTEKITGLQEALTLKDEAYSQLTKKVEYLDNELTWLAEASKRLQRESEVANWLRSALSNLAENYPVSLKTNLEQLKADSVDEISALWEVKVKEYEPLVAQLQKEENMSDLNENTLTKLEEKGFDKIEDVRPAWEEKINGIELSVNESVMEHFPKVLHVMDKVNESMGGLAKFNPGKKQETQSQKLAVAMLEKYLVSHEDQILAGALEWENLNRRREDARRKGISFDETPTLRTAYNLPYLVMAGILPEVYASLASPEVFTVMPLKHETQRYYVEAWGATPTASVSNEALTVEVGAWANLAHKFIVKDSVVVSSGATEYDMFDDFVVDTEEGRIWFIDGGALDDDDEVVVAYNYELLAEGENAPIEFIGTTANHATLVVTAKRLGFNLTDEAIKFAASDIGYDARGSHLQTATYRMAQSLDKKMFEMAEAYAYAGNMKTNSWSAVPGTGVTNEDNLRALVDRIADAVDLIERYYYTPTHIAMARTLAHKFHSSDLLDYDVQRAGVSLTNDLVAGTLHNLPVYGVPYGQFGTSSVLILAGRDTVVKGIYSPLEAVGGEGFINRATTGNTNRLVAARAWYLQEYYDIVVPVDPTDSNLIRRIAVVPVV
jgi:hypothetical protein